MKSYIKLISLIMALFLCAMSLTSCSKNNKNNPNSKKETISAQKNKTQNSSYIKIDNNELSKEYIGYFFYVAQLNMISEAGMILGDGGNSTEADVAEFWKTTEIEGRKAVDVARDLAADNAVMLTVQYLKAVEEGIVLSDGAKADIENQIKNAKETSGGEDSFKQKLSEMSCSEDAYKQILTENLYLNMLYQKYDFEGKLDISDEELLEYTQNNPYVASEYAIEFAKKEKFNAMSQEWKKEFDIVINDENMKKFNVK